MAAVLENQPKPGRKSIPVPPLQNGDRLTAKEFLRRYEAMPEIKKAELIEGIVYMGSPVSLNHAEPDALIQGWLFNYSVLTPGTSTAANVTVRLDADNVPQPDGLLRVLPEFGGKSRADEKDYLSGAPELIVEISTSTASIDLRGKLTAYRRAGVREYMVWRTLDGEMDWFVLEDEEYQSNQRDAHGIIRSRIFPGLWLDVNAALAMNAAKVIETLNAGLSTSEHAAFVKKLKAAAKA